MDGNGDIIAIAELPVTIQIDTPEVVEPEEEPVIAICPAVSLTIDDTDF